MDKFETFFVKGQLLSQEEYNTLEEYCNFDIKLPDESLKKIKVTLDLINPLPLDLYKKIQELKDKWSTQVLFELAPKKRLHFSNEILKEYLKYFCDEKINSTVSFRNFLLTIPFNTDENGLLIFQYFNEGEYKELKLNETLLKNFFNSICFACVKIDYQLDKDRQELEFYKQKKLEKIKADQKNVLPDANALVRKANDVGKAKVTKIQELTPELGTAIISGQIFEKDVIVTKNNFKIYKFSITDYSGAISIKIFEGVKNTLYRKVNLPASYLDTFKIGDWIKARVDLQVDPRQFNELTGTVQKIVPCQPDEKFIPTDKAPTKRVELLARTKMSAFDGLINTNDLVKRSKDYGWNAISVIDRYNVQSFPDAMSSAKKNKQKIIYGVEVDALHRQIPVVLNPVQTKINDATYVVFDLETTGLYNEFEDIIEFGAVKVKNGMILDTIDMFIKPSKPLPAKIVELTHITDAMLEEAKPIKTALKEILGWIGDAVLIAHNGINFDYRFLNKKLIQNGFEPINNPLIDTLQISRSIHKDQSKHTLGAICRKYKIEYTDEIAHRADFDAEVLNRVWSIMQHMLKNMNIDTIDQINSIQCDELYSRQFQNYVNLYVKQQPGIKDIYKIVSYSFTKNLFSTPRVFVDEINSIRNNLIVANSPTEGDIWDIALNGLDSELETAMQFYDYIFVVSPANLLHEIGNELITLNNVKKTIKKIISTAKKLNKKVVAVSDAYYLDKTDQIAHRVYVNSKLLGGKRHRLYRYDSNNEQLPDLHLRTTAELLDEFAFLADEQLIKQIVIDNSNEFEKQISNDIKPLKDGLHAPKIADATEKLQTIVWENARKKYGDKLPELIESRIKRELNGIVSNNYGIIYWISHLLVAKSLSDGYLVGSRGSVGSSLVAYLSNISEVNPLPPHYICPHCKTSIFTQVVDDGYDLPQKLCPNCGNPMIGDGHNIPFETFLGFHGEKVPDIDLNFSGEYQPKAHEFIREMFGKEHTYRAGTIATVASKTAFGYVKNYFESLELDQPMRQSEINWIVNKCVDVKRTTGQHPGGIIIVPKEMDIFDFSPYNYPADDKTQTWYTSHFAFESLHDNLLKFDILGHDDPTTLRFLQNVTNINPKDIPFHDEDVMKLFSSLESLHIIPEEFLNQEVGSVGLPEFGTGFVRKMLAATKPQTFADLVRISGLSHGTDVWLNNASDLITQMHLTLPEVISCRDDIMLTLISKGIDSSVAFNIMESVRKGKGIKPEHLKILQDNNIPQWYIDSCNKIKYLFPKAHATAYVIMAWRIAWFKIHYPLAFYAAYFGIRCEVFDIASITSGPEVIKQRINDIRTRLDNRATKKDVKKKEIDLLDVYEVALELYLRGFKIVKPNIEKSLAKEFVIEGNSLIIPFNKIDQLGDVGAESIVEERNKRPFISKQDLISRAKISTTILQYMEKIGMLDDLEEDNQLSLF